MCEIKQTCERWSTPSFFLLFLPLCLRPFFCVCVCVCFQASRSNGYPSLFYWHARLWLAFWQYVSELHFRSKCSHSAHTPSEYNPHEPNTLWEQAGCVTQWQPTHDQLFTLRGTNGEQYCVYVHCKKTCYVRNMARIEKKRNAKRQIVYF